MQLKTTSNGKKLPPNQINTEPEDLSPLKTTILSCSIGSKTFMYVFFQTAPFSKCFPSKLCYFAFFAAFHNASNYLLSVFSDNSVLIRPFLRTFDGHDVIPVGSSFGKKPRGFRPKLHRLKTHNNPSVTWAGKPRLGTTPGILHLDGRGHSGFCVCHPSQIYGRWFVLLKTESIRRIFEYVAKKHH